MKKPSYLLKTGIQLFSLKLGKTWTSLPTTRDTQNIWFIWNIAINCLWLQFLLMPPVNKCLAQKCKSCITENKTLLTNFYLSKISPRIIFLLLWTFHLFMIKSVMKSRSRPRRLFKKFRRKKINPLHLSSPKI